MAIRFAFYTGLPSQPDHSDPTLSAEILVETIQQSLPTIGMMFGRIVFFPEQTHTEYFIDIFTKAQSGMDRIELLRTGWRGADYFQPSREA